MKPVRLKPVLTSVKPVMRRQSEKGYALLILFLMSAAVAYSLYQQLPRVAFESAREKEQLLMDRGNQYKRAIQVYYAVNKRYPAKIEDLENTNNQRFLRRRYIDPMTGKDEWRLIHSNGSALTDSLVVKPPTQNAQNTNLPGGGPLGTNSMNTAPSSTTAAPADGQTPVQVNAAVIQRPSDRTITSGLPQNGGQNPNRQNLPNVGFPIQGASGNYDPNDPRTWPAITLAPQTTQNGSANGTQANTGAANAFPFPGGNQAGVGQATQNQLNQLPSNQNTFNQNQTNQQIQLAAGGIFGGANQNNGLTGQQPGLGGQNPQQVNLTSQDMNANVSSNLSPNVAPSPLADGSNPALGLIGEQLTRPAPPPQPAAPATNIASSIGSAIQSIFTGSGGSSANNSSAAPGAALGLFPNAPGATAANGANGAAGTTGGPGIAGVATKFEGPSIKTYKERQKYQEWEFIYDPSQTTGQTGTQTTAQPGQNNPLQSNPAQSGFGLPQPSGGPIMPSQSPANPGSAPSPFGLPAQVQ